jgi:hypothetical protein
MGRHIVIMHNPLVQPNIWYSFDKYAAVNFSELEDVSRMIS